MIGAARAVTVTGGSARRAPPPVGGVLSSRPATVAVSVGSARGNAK